MNLSHATIRNTQAPRRGQRKVEDTTADERTAVIDYDDDASASVGDAQLGTEGQAAVRCC
jgi:hypothetical protein